jgi:ABC-2 type transport system permease protein
MIRTFRAEFVKLLRRRVLLITAAVTLLTAVGGSAIVLAAAKPAAQAGGVRPVTLEQLGRAGGGTDVFRIVTSFAGTFLFVVFIAVFAVEFSRGTIRTMLLRQPRRVPMLAGKLAALLTFAAVTLAAGEVVTWITARMLAPSNDVATGAWTSAHALGAAVTDYGAVLLWVTGYAVLGTMVAVLLRSVPVALGVGIAWAGPVEHLLQDAWSPASRLFPGLLLEAFVAGGNANVSAGRALATLTVYVMVAAALAATVFARRDVIA